MIRLVLGVGGVAGCAFDSGHLRHLGLAIGVLTLGPFLGEKTYTKLSLLVLLAGMLEEYTYPGVRSPILPAMFVNFVALSASFHTAHVLDPTAFNRMAESNGWSLSGFYVRHYLVHVLPIVVLIMWIRWHGVDEYLEVVPCSPALGACTAAFHFMWAYLSQGSLNLSSVYIRFSDELWHRMWLVAAVTHIITSMAWGFLLQH